MKKNKLYILLSFLTITILFATSAICNQCATTTELPTIALQIYDGPNYSESDDMCYYQIEATATGTPDPVVEFSTDSNVSPLENSIVEVGVNTGDSYTLTATATNDSGTASASIILFGECGEEVAEEEEALAEEEEEEAPAEEEEAEEEEVEEEVEEEELEVAEILTNEVIILPDENLSGTVYASGHTRSAMELFGMVYFGDTTTATQSKGYLSFDITELHGREVQNAEIRFTHLEKVGNPESFASNMDVRACDYGTFLDADDFLPGGTRLTRIPLSSTSYTISNDTLITELQNVLDSSRDYFQLRIGLNGTTNDDDIGDNLKTNIINVLLQIIYSD